MKKTIIALMLVVLFLGCTAQDTSDTTPTLNVETRCESTEDLCIIGTPGLLNQDSIYSGSDTFFSLVLRNNLEGQEAYNVEVQLKNVGPFRIVEGYETYNDKQGVCQLEVGVWKPHDKRSIFNSPNPQFVGDLGEPFAVHMLDVMYPDEEVEFQWQLRSPDYQEIANVAYEHGFNYVVSYDYKSGLLQTVYAMSEEEYQRQLSQTGSEPTTSGTTTPSVGALHISSNVDEPVRVQGEGSQFAITYEVYNQRVGVPLTPALFLLQYPEGVRNVGTFIGPQSLDSYGYVDLRAAVEYYNTFGIGLDGGVCLPDSFDTYSDILENARRDSNGVNYLGGSAKCSESFTSVSLDDLIAYIRKNFPDVTFNASEPRFVLKFLYPVDLIDETNYLYYQLETEEDVDISKYYTFRLKTKYRYSFTGEDEILVVPNPASFDSTTAAAAQGVIWGDMNPKFTHLAGSEGYSLSGDTLTITRSPITLTSTIKDLRADEYRFLHIVGLTTIEEPATSPCTKDADCGVNYCNSGVCQECIGEECTDITTPAFYTVDIGYYTLDSHINTVLGTSGASYFLKPSSSGEVLYFFDELNYMNKVATGDRTANTNHNVSLLIPDNPTVQQAVPIINDFVQRKSFFEVKNDDGLILTDNDETGFDFDYVTYQDFDNSIPNSMKLISYYENESLFMESVGSNELIGMYTSPLGEAISDTLILYFFNNDETNHYFEYNISLLNATTALTGEVVVDKGTFNLADTNKYNSFNEEDYPYTKNVGANTNLRNIISLGDQTDTVNCQVNSENVNPVLILDYEDFDVNPLTGEFQSSYGSGSIVIGDYDSLNDANTALGTTIRPGASFIKGVVNICYKRGLV